MTTWHFGAGDVVGLCCAVVAWVVAGAAFVGDADDAQRGHVQHWLFARGLCLGVVRLTR